MNTPTPGVPAIAANALPWYRWPMRYPLPANESNGPLISVVNLAIWIAALLLMKRFLSRK